MSYGIYNLIDFFFGFSIIGSFVAVRSLVNPGENHWYELQLVIHHGEGTKDVKHKQVLSYTTLPSV